MPPPANISPRLLSEVADLGEGRALRRGETLYEAGSPPGDLFLVISGELRLERTTPAGPQPLGFAREGDFAGAAEALLGIPRVGQAIAIQESSLFAIPAAELFGGAPSAELGDFVFRGLASHLRALNDEFGNFFPGSARGKTETPDGGTPIDLPAEEKTRALAAGLSIADAALLAAICREEAHAEGAVIFREGDEGRALCVVARGQVRISRRIGGAGEEAFAILSPGAIFGELAVFDAASPLRSADAIAHTDCTLLTLDRAAIEQLRHDAPAKAASLTAALCRLVAQRIAETSERLVRWRLMAGMF